MDHVWRQIRAAKANSVLDPKCNTVARIPRFTSLEPNFARWPRVPTMMTLTGWLRSGLDLWILRILRHFCTLDTLLKHPRTQIHGDFDNSRKHSRRTSRRTDSRRCVRALARLSGLRLSRLLHRRRCVSKLYS
jgi:hypothetical protein